MAPTNAETHDTHYGEVSVRCMVETELRNATSSLSGWAHSPWHVGTLIERGRERETHISGPSPTWLQLGSEDIGGAESSGMQ